LWRRLGEGEEIKEIKKPPYPGCFVARVWKLLKIREMIF